VIVSPGPEGFSYSVAQYGPGDADWLRRKLLQYPASTAFRIVGSTDEARERAGAVVSAAGRTVVE
jgi:hypothetical protein